MPRPPADWPEPYLQAEGLAECRRCGHRYPRSRGRGHGAHCPDCRDVLRSDDAQRKGTQPRRENRKINTTTMIES
jgi:tRNA(Ile2) C34 agmatinyltransferase TiaS